MNSFFIWRLNVNTKDSIKISFAGFVTLILKREQFINMKYTIQMI
nr:MAG TPA: hypothetical protein [Caudoviricetes sp.]